MTAAFQDKLQTLVDVISKDPAPNNNAWMQALIEMLAAGIATNAATEQQRGNMLADALTDLKSRTAHYADKTNVVSINDWKAGP